MGRNLEELSRRRITLYNENGVARELFYFFFFAPRSPAQGGIYFKAGEAALEMEYIHTHTAALYVLYDRSASEALSYRVYIPSARHAGIK